MKIRNCSNTLIILLLYILLFSLFSCEKDKEFENNPKNERYPINYNFINSTANYLQAMKFEVRTYFPIENITNCTFENAPIIRPYNTIRISVDTANGMGHFGYIGCTTQMLINIYSDYNDTLTSITTWVTRPDTIKSKADANIYFNWPSDTLYSEKRVRYIYSI